MAKQKKTTKKKLTKAEQEKQERRKYIYVGLALLFFTVFGFFKIGFLGRSVTNVFRLIGGDTYYLLALGLTVYALLLIYFGGEPHFKKKRIPIGIFIFYFGLLLFLQARLFESQHGSSVDIMGITWQKLYSDLVTNSITQSVGGGMVGAGLYFVTYHLVDQVGTYIVSFILMFGGIMLVCNVQYEQIIAVFDRIGRSLHGASKKASERRKESRDEKRQIVSQEKKQKEESKKVKKKPVKSDSVLPDDLSFEVNQDMMNDVIEPDIKPEILPKRSDFEKQASAKPVQPEKVDSASPDVQFGVAEEVEDLDYELPSSTLLNDIPVKDQSEDYEKIEKNIEILERTFKSFGVNIKVVRASLGPSVTKYELQPAVGVKVSKIVSLTDDIALALAAKDVRIEAPIPGKSLVGIEVPNSQVSTVAFRDIIEGSTCNPEKLLEVPLGRDISGAVISADLSKMPHLLIAGSTGSGKSVCINGIIISLLMNSKPHEVKLMMIDPKMVELNVYNGIPHLLTPVVTNPRKASQALHKVVEEMERRYELFAKSGMRNISGYNQFVKQKNLEEGSNHPTLPFIVVIVDELADLMMVASNEVEDAITRLAQMARAAGIHMILATQRPSVDVITGIIKANVPSRIAFAVSSGVDSRTIIDSAGAEKLLGRGDMLFLPMGENKPVRVQGAFISDAEVERVVTFVSSQQEANYVESMMPTDEVDKPSEVPKDALYDEACQLVIEMQTASASLLQRRFRIGYNRAARIVDELEANRVIGPAEGSKPRKVFAQSVPSQPTLDEQEMEDNSEN